MQEHKFVTGKFTLDAHPDLVFDGYKVEWADGTNDDWNGWAVPYFIRDEAERILKACVEVAEELFPVNGYTFEWHYDADKNEFVVDGDGSGPMAYAGRLIIDSEGFMNTVYPIGTYEWTWSEVEA